MAHHGKEWKKLGDGSLPTEDQHSGLGHIVSVPTYKAVFYSLLMLTFLTVWAAMHHFGIFNLALALIIASIKATLVGMFFMHLKFESKLLWIIAIYPFFILGLMILGTLGDTSVKPLPQPLHNQANSATR